MVTEVSKMSLTIVMPAWHVSLSVQSVASASRERLENMMVENIAAV